MKKRLVLYCLIGLLPLLATLSASMVRLYSNFSLALTIPCLVAAIIAIVIIGGKLPSYIYPIVVYSIGLSLMIHSESTLGSNYLYGGDIQAEYSIRNLASSMSNGWRTLSGSNLTTSLSITVVWAYLPSLFHIDPIWFYKITTPFLLASAPLFLYVAYKGQLGERIAFLSSMLFLAPLIAMAYYGFRMTTGWFLLTLSIMLLTTPLLKLSIRVPLLILSSVCVVFSYYANGLFYCCMLVALCLLLPLLRLYTKKQLLLPLKYVVIVAVITVSVAAFWYNRNDATVVDVVQRIEESQKEQIVEDISKLSSTAVVAGKTESGQVAPVKGKIALLDIKTRKRGVAMALGMDFNLVSTQGKVFRVAQIIIEFFICVGLINAVVRLRKSKWSNEFTIFGGILFFMMVGCVVLPYLSSWWEAERFYQLSLVILAPFCVVGGGVLLKPIPKLSKVAIPIITTVVIVYFLFHSGVVFEVTRSTQADCYDHPSAMILSSYRIDSPNWSESDYNALQWLKNNGYIPFRMVYADAYAMDLLNQFGYPRIGILHSNTSIQVGSYIFLRSYNTNTNTIASIKKDGEWVTFYHENGVPYSVNWDKIYSIGGSEIYVVAPH